MQLRELVGDVQLRELVGDVRMGLAVGKPVLVDEHLGSRLDLDAGLLTLTDGSESIDGAVEVWLNVNLSGHCLFSVPSTLKRSSIGL